ncbi:hypothetical protein HELRODRAFT_170765 [Helobdella robusta]|uniref:Ion transport domain-containing protein n=1 Tax=Helobdella robusta TaxID=6412 RepID=T1F3E3_HELRO|nr:hypothetical protein HELRODRAFT_170765 [Helobdella robusta]ESO07430.1 hypothetical protein HELRODRAFT_170765 [Helobdella robusta]
MLLLDTLPMLGNVLLLCFFVFFVFGILGVQLWAGLLRQRCYLKLPDNATADGYNLSDFYTPPNSDKEFLCSKDQDNGMTKCSDIPPRYFNGKKCNLPAPEIITKKLLTIFQQTSERDDGGTSATDLIRNKKLLGRNAINFLRPPTTYYNGSKNELFEVILEDEEHCINWNQYYTECKPLGDNPFLGSISFDNIGMAWVAIFQVISMEGWSEIMYYIQDTHTFWDWSYFVLLIVIGSFFMINLCLVVISAQFSETKQREMERILMERNMVRFRSSMNSLSTIASEDDDMEAGCYEQLMACIERYARRYKRRFKKWFMGRFRKKVIPSLSAASSERKSFFSRKSKKNTLPKLIVTRPKNMVVPVHSHSQSRIPKIAFNQNSNLYNRNENNNVNIDDECDEFLGRSLMGDDTAVRNDEAEQAGENENNSTATQNYQNIYVSNNTALSMYNDDNQIFQNICDNNNINVKDTCRFNNISNFQLKNETSKMKKANSNADDDETNELSSMRLSSTFSDIDLFSIVNGLFPVASKSSQVQKFAPRASPERSDLDINSLQSYLLVSDKMNGLNDESKCMCLMDDSRCMHTNPSLNVIDNCSLRDRAIIWQEEKFLGGNCRPSSYHEPNLRIGSFTRERSTSTNRRHSNCNDNFEVGALDSCNCHLTNDLPTPFLKFRDSFKRLQLELKSQKIHQQYKPQIFSDVNTSSSSSAFHFAILSLKRQNLNQRRISLIDQQHHHQECQQHHHQEYQQQQQLSQQQKRKKIDHMTSDVTNPCFTNASFIMHIVGSVTKHASATATKKWLPTTSASSTTPTTSPTTSLSRRISTTATYLIHSQSKCQPRESSRSTSALRATNIALMADHKMKEGSSGDVIKLDWKPYDAMKTFMGNNCSREQFDDQHNINNSNNSINNNSNFNNNNDTYNPAKPSEPRKKSSKIILKEPTIPTSTSFEEDIQQQQDGNGAAEAISYSLKLVLPFLMGVPMLTSSTSVCRLVGCLKKMRLAVKAVVDSTWFQRGILISIFVNSIFMGIEFHNQPEVMTLVGEYSNMIFTCLFAFEMLLKIFADGLFGYIRIGFNAFDGVIVIVSIVEIAQGDSGGLSVLRTFRLLRILKLVRFLPALRYQLVVMLKTMDNVATFFALLMLFIFIFSILGMNLFGCKFCDVNPITGEKQCWRKNFDSLLWATVTVFQILTQEDWNEVLYMGMSRTHSLASLYFILLLTFGNYVLFNLLVAILVEGFASEAEEANCQKSASIAKSFTSTDSIDAHKTTSATNNNNDGNPETSNTNLSFSRPESPGTHHHQSHQHEHQQHHQQPTNTQNLSPIHLNQSQRYSDSQPSSRFSIKITDKSKYSGVGVLNPKNKWLPLVQRTSKVAAKHPTYLLHLDKLDVNSIKYKENAFLAETLGKSDEDSNLKIFFIEMQQKLKWQLCECRFCPTTPHGFFRRRVHYTFYCMSPLGRFRKFCINLVVKKWFDYLILFIIALNCITLAMERPTIPDDCPERQFLTISNYIFTIIFGLEMFIKVIARGLLLGHFAYLNNGWNVMDGMLVCVSVVDIVITLTADHSPKIFGILRVFRILRTLRPLRVITQAPGLKLVVRTLLTSLRPIGNIVLICCTFFVIFGILGVQLFKGTFYHCDGPELYDVKNKSDCLGKGVEYRWLNRKYNFDHLGHALMTLFVLASMDGWVNIMYSGLDAVGVDQQPIMNYNEWRLIYFISFLLLVGFFVLNMFVGVVVENFHKCQEKQEEEDKMTLEKFRRNAIPEKADEEKAAFWQKYPRWRMLVTTVVTSKYFDLAIAAIIGLNILSMAMEFYLMPKELSFALKILNVFFTAIFVIEAILKVTALGFVRYIMDRWNQLDVMIVILSITGIVFEEVRSGYVPINPTIIRVMRVLRIARVLKLLKMAKSVRALLDTVMQALPDAGNLGLLFFLLFFIFAALGVELFGRIECSEVHECEGLSKHAHFQYFGMALLTLFRVATGDNWNGIMKAVSFLPSYSYSSILICSYLDVLRDDCDASDDCSKNCCINAFVAPAFFVTFVLIAQFVLINVVVAVLMKHLEDGKDMNTDEMDDENEGDDDDDEQEKEDDDDGGDGKYFGTSIGQDEENITKEKVGELKVGAEKGEQKLHLPKSRVKIFVNGNNDGSRDDAFNNSNNNNDNSKDDENFKTNSLSQRYNVKCEIKNSVGNIGECSDSSEMQMNGMGSLRQFARIFKSLKKARSDVNICHKETHRFASSTCDVASYRSIDEASNPATTNNENIATIVIQTPSFMQQQQHRQSPNSSWPHYYHSVASINFLDVGDCVGQQTTANSHLSTHL